MGDGFHQDKYSNYKERLKAAEKVGLCDENVVQDLSCTLNAISKDLEFLQAGEYMLSIIWYVLISN